MIIFTLCYTLFLRKKHLILFLIICVVTGCRDSSLFNPPEIPVNDMKEGDIVFRKGCSYKSRAVLHADKTGKFSHVGMVVETESGLKIIHIVPGENTGQDTTDRIKMEDITAFFASDRAESGAITRFGDSVACIKQAREYLLKMYKKNIEFDHDYCLDDTTKMYCTELIWRAYLSGGRDITLGKRSEINNFASYSGVYIFPSDIYDHPSLITIYEF